MSAQPLDGIDCVGYLRVSTAFQARPEATSLPGQRAEIEEFAAANGRTVGRWYEDAGVSGGTSDRPAFQAMLADCTTSPRRDRTPGLVVTQDVARWGRFENVVEGTAIRFRLAQQGWLVRHVMDGSLNAPIAHTALSPETAQKVQAYLDERAGIRDHFEFRTILVGLLVDAPSDTHALTVLRLCQDFDARGSDSALMRVLVGDVDLVALLEEQGE